MIKIVKCKIPVNSCVYWIFGYGILNLSVSNLSVLELFHSKGWQ